MTGPPDFIDVKDLVVLDDGRTTESKWPESSTLPQRAIKLILDAGISYYGQAANKFAIQRALPFLEESELETVERLVAEQPLEVIHGFARKGAKFPVVAIVLANETSPRGTAYLNDYQTVGRDEYGDAGGEWVDIHGVEFDTALNLLVYASDSPDIAIYWYELVKFILIQSRKILAELGIDNPEISGGDIKPLPEFIPELIYLRELRLKFRTRQVFAEEIKLIDHLEAFVRLAFTEQNVALTELDDSVFVGKSDPPPERSD